VRIAECGERRNESSDAFGSSRHPVHRWGRPGNGTGSGLLSLENMQQRDFLLWRHIV
jgi:hypothetical protein